MELFAQVKISPVASSLAILYLTDAENKIKNQCDTAYDTERVIDGWRVAPQKCLGCEGYDIQCSDYSYERNKK